MPDPFTTLARLTRILEGLDLAARHRWLARQRVPRRPTCDLIDREAFDKIDVFVSRDTPWPKLQTARRRQREPDFGTERLTVYLPSPEDVVLAKPEWYEMGGRASDRQRSAVLGVMPVQGSTLDREYMRQWADAIGVAALLALAQSQAHRADDR